MVKYNCGGFGLVGGGVVAAGAAAGAVAVGLGTIVVGGGIAVGVIGLQVLFSKGFGPRIGHNQHEKQMWKEAVKQLGLEDKDLISRLHNAIHKYPYQDNLKGLINTLKEILDGWGIAF